MKKIIFGSFLVVALFNACNGDEDSKTTDNVDSVKTTTVVQNTDSTGMNKDADFAVAAANGGMLEIKLSQLAATNATAASIKSMAAMLVTDHTKAADELKGIAAKNNISLPASLGADDQKTYDDMAALKGSDFDKAYMNKMEADHKATIDKFQTEADKGMNADLKTFATNTLPTLNHHLDMVNSMMKGMK